MHYVKKFIALLYHISENNAHIGRKTKGIYSEWAYGSLHVMEFYLHLSVFPNDFLNDSARQKTLNQGSLSQL